MNSLRQTILQIQQTKLNFNLCCHIQSYFRKLTSIKKEWKIAALETRYRFQLITSWMKRMLNEAAWKSKTNIHSASASFILSFFFHLPSFKPYQLSIPFWFLDFAAVWFIAPKHSQTAMQRNQKWNGAGWFGILAPSYYRSSYTNCHYYRQQVYSCSNNCTVIIFLQAAN